MAESVQKSGFMGRNEAKKVRKMYNPLKLYRARGRNKFV